MKKKVENYDCLKLLMISTIPTIYLLYAYLLFLQLILKMGNATETVYDFANNTVTDRSELKLVIVFVASFLHL